MLFIIITIFTCALPLPREPIKYFGKIVSNSKTVNRYFFSHLNLREHLLMNLLRTRGGRNGKESFQRKIHKLTKI